MQSAVPRPEPVLAPAPIINLVDVLASNVGPLVMRLLPLGDRRALRATSRGACDASDAATTRLASPPAPACRRWRWWVLPSRCRFCRKLTVKGPASLPQEDVDGLLAADLPMLERLRMVCCSLTEGAAAALASSRWPALRELDLSRNAMGAAVATAIADACPSTLQVCVASFCRFMQPVLHVCITCTAG